MIARVWHGYTKPEHADSYEAMLKPELLPGISKKKGYRGSYLLRRELGSEVEFITVLLWDSIDDLRAAAGRRLRNGHHSPGAAKVFIAIRHQGRTL